eukprot:s2050_g7.t1
MTVQSTVNFVQFHQSTFQFHIHVSLLMEKTEASLDDSGVTIQVCKLWRASACKSTPRLATLRLLFAMESEPRGVNAFANTWIIWEVEPIRIRSGFEGLRRD